MFLSEIPSVCAWVFPGFKWKRGINSTNTWRLETCHHVKKPKTVDHNGKMITLLTVLISTSGNKISRRVMETATKEHTWLHLIYALLIKLWPKCALSSNSDMTQKPINTVGYIQVDAIKVTNQSITKKQAQAQPIPSRKSSSRLDLTTDHGKRSPSFQKKLLWKKPLEIKITLQKMPKKKKSIPKNPNKKNSLERRRNHCKKKHLLQENTSLKACTYSISSSFLSLSYLCSLLLSVLFSLFTMLFKWLSNLTRRQTLLLNDDMTLYGLLTPLISVYMIFRSYS